MPATLLVTSADVFLASSADHSSHARNVVPWCGLRVYCALLDSGGALSTTAWLSGRLSMATRGCRLLRANLGGG